MDYIRSILLDRPTIDRPWFDQQFVHAKLVEHFEGKRNHRLLIWSLLSFELLQRHFIDRPLEYLSGAPRVAAAEVSRLQEPSETVILRELSELARLRERSGPAGLPEWRSPSARIPANSAAGNGGGRCP
jgi:hypothetical protein